MKPMPKISELMVPMPHKVHQDVSVRSAYDLMQEHRIRHLPVHDSRKLVGILSDRDLHLAMFLSQSQKLKVSDVMTTFPYFVSPSTPLDQVVLTMVKNKYGCAVVCEENGISIGIFTAVDALSSFNDLLRNTFKPTEP